MGNHFAWVVIDGPGKAIDCGEVARCLVSVADQIGSTIAALTEIEGGGDGLPALTREVGSPRWRDVDQLSREIAELDGIDWLTILLARVSRKAMAVSDCGLELALKNGLTVFRVVDSQYTYVYGTGDADCARVKGLVPSAELIVGAIAELPDPF